MKSIILFLSIFLVGQAYSTEKNESQVIAKGIQCTYLREKSFFDVYELYSTEKTNPEYIKKVSDSIYSQAFKICDPENSENAAKEIHTVCANGCDQFALKGVMGIGGSSLLDIAKCKTMCLNYSDLLGFNYTGATKALKKYLELNPPTSKKVEAAEIAPTAAPAITTPEKIEEKKK